jgi:putative transcriptional regulator
MRRNMPKGHTRVNACQACTGKNYAQPAVAPGSDAGHDVCMYQLARIRKARRLTQTQLAEAVGCHQATISKLERGDKNVTLDLAERIARVLKVEPWELFGMDDLRQRYLEALAKATPARREAILLLLEGDDGFR